MKTTHKEQGKAVIYTHFVIRVVLKAVLYYKMKCFSIKSVCGRCVSRCLKEHSAIVVKKEFWLRKALNFLKTFTK